MTQGLAADKVVCVCGYVSVGRGVGSVGRSPPGAPLREKGNKGRRVGHSFLWDKGAETKPTSQENTLRPRRGRSSVSLVHPAALCSGETRSPCLWGNCCLDQVQSPGRVSSAPWGLGSLFVGKEQHLGVRLFLLEAFSLLPPVENKDSSVGVGEGCPLNPGGWMPGCTDEIGAPARGAGGCSWEERYSNIQATVSTTPWGEWGQGGRQTRPGGCAQGSLAPGE